MTINLDLWERPHANGFVAVAWRDRRSSGGYRYHARQQFVPSAHWARRGDDLAEAQRLADALVPSHDCRCPGWQGRQLTAG